MEAAPLCLLLLAARDCNLRLLPHCIDWYAQHHGDKQYTRRTARQQDGSLLLEPVTYTDFARAVDRAASWLDPSLAAGKSSTFAYFGPQDIRWTVLFVAAIKSRCKMVFVSPWATPHNTAKMLATFDRLTLIYDEEPTHIFDEYLEVQIQGLIKLRVPSLKYFLSNAQHVAYRYDGTWDRRADDVVAFFHTSGTTGTPKPVALSNRRIWVFGAACLACFAGHNVLIPDFSNKRVLTTFYISHIGGISTQLIWPVYLGCTFLTCPVGEAVSSRLIDEILCRFHIEAAALTPGLMNELASQSAALATLRRLQTILTGGSPASPKVASLVSAENGPAIQHFYGCTESWPSMQKPVARHLAHCIALHPLGGAHMVAYSANLFEFVIRQSENLKAFQPAFHCSSSKDQFRSGDLFSRHPTEPDHWVFHGRVDDVITLSNNQNIHIGVMERAVMEDARVVAALIGGSGYPAPVLLLELSAEYRNSLQQHVRPIQDAVDSVWPAVEAANSPCSSNAALRKSLTLVVDQPLVRTAKGSIDRTRTWKLFEDKIDRMYAAYRASAGIRGEQAFSYP